MMQQTNGAKCPLDGEVGQYSFDNGAPNGEGGIASQIGGPFPDPPFFGGPEVRAADDFVVEFESNINSIAWTALESLAGDGSGDETGINWAGQVRLEIRNDGGCAPGDAILNVDLDECVDNGPEGVSGACVVRMPLPEDQGALELNRVEYMISGLDLDLAPGRYWLSVAPISHPGTGQSFWEASSTGDLACEALIQAGPLGINDWSTVADASSLNFVINGCVTDPVLVDCGTGVGNCMLADDLTPGCEVGSCCAAVCASGLIECCTDAWTQACVEAAVEICDGLLAGCNVPLPADTIIDLDDPCGLSTNDGCLALDPETAFAELPEGDFTLLGTLSASSADDFIDSDWYAFSLNDDSEVELSFRSAFPGRLRIFANFFDEKDPGTPLGGPINVCDEFDSEAFEVELITSDCGQVQFDDVLPAGNHLIVVLFDDVLLNGGVAGKGGLVPDLPCGTDNEYIVEASIFPIVPEACGDAIAGSCFEENGTPYCDDEDCCELVCAGDPFCCDTEWDAACVEDALAICVDDPKDNNFCAGATEVFAGDEIAGSLSNATFSGIPSPCIENDAQRDRWYQFEAPADGTLELSTCGTANIGGLMEPLDTSITVYGESCPGFNGTPAGIDPGNGFIACNSYFSEGNFPDACPGFGGPAGGGLLGDLDAALKVDLQAGDVVHIRISGTWPLGGSNGSFLFQVDFVIDDDQPTGCLGDLNEDGVVNVFDLLSLLENWGSCVNIEGKFGFCPGDLNEDGVVNVFDLLILLENWGDCPDETGCGDADAGDCCESNGTPFCNDAACCELVCADDPFCCDTTWDSLCADAANDGCEVCQKEPACGVAGTGDCCEDTGTPFCDDELCCQLVCAADPFCCNTTWDSLCANNDLTGAAGLCAICQAVK